MPNIDPNTISFWESFKLDALTPAIVIPITPKIANTHHGINQSINAGIPIMAAITTIVAIILNINSSCAVK